MTRREFLEMVIAETGNDEIKVFAESEIEKMREQIQNVE